MKAPPEEKAAPPAMVDEAGRLMTLIADIRTTVERHGYVAEISTTPDLVYKHHIMKLVVRDKGQ